MTDDDQDYAGLLRTLKDSPATETSTVSIDRAVQAGRRTVRRRRVGGGIAVVALIAAASVTPLVLDSVRNGEPPVAPPTQPQENHDFSLWSQAFESGSASGFRPASYLTARKWQQIILKPATAEVEKFAQARVTMFARGERPHTDNNNWSLSDNPVAAIEGRPAALVSQSKDGIEIVWQYADDSWGMVDITGSSTAATIDRARYLAEAVHRGEGRAISVPFTISKQALALTPELEVVGVWTSLGSTSAEYRLMLEAEQNAGAPMDEPRMWAGVVKPAPAITPTSTIDGRPARVDANLTTIFNAGLGYTAQARVAPTSSYSYDFTAVAKSIRLVPNAESQSAWTTTPLR